MATKSILKSINIKDRKSALALVRALENAEGKKSKVVHQTRVTSDASREDIRLIFGTRK